ncbi:hypothetical protein [Ramlibacter sp. AN1133]|uniref:hypothetical protein n=1 Tax=Ramlibacter sp. AN1133 TaxID=3133429 RepID=UPI0030BF966F
MPAPTPTTSTRRSSKRGRADGIQLAPDRVKGLREEADLTQERAATGLHRLVNPSWSPTSDKAQLTTYQRIESTGKTSRKRAVALAQLFRTTLAVLQGDTPDDGPSLAQRVEAQLRDQLAKGANPALQARLHQLQREGVGDRVEWLAGDLAHEIEEAQLAQDQGELNRLSRITGWSQQDLQSAGVQLGHWMVVSGLNRTSRITTGLQSAIEIVKEEGAELLRLAGDEAAITFTEDLPWLRIEITSARWVMSGRMRLVISVVRCLPTVRGIQWQNPTWRDRSWIDLQLPRWAYSQAEFVTWQGVRHPKDIRQLRLLIERRIGGAEPEQVSLHQGALAELSEDHAQRFADGAFTHAEVLRIVRLELFDALSPHLADWPLQHWRVHPGESGIAITLDLTGGTYRDRSRRDIPAFAIRLVEVEQDKLIPAPWRHSSLEATAKLLAEQLVRAQALQGQAQAQVATGAPRPDLWQTG